MNRSTESDNRWYPQYPMVAVSAVIIKEGRVLLIKRAKEPSKGRWSIPGGRHEVGETIYTTAKREVFEECNIEIEILQLLDVGDNIIRDDEGRVQYHFVLIDLLAKHTGGEIKAQSDAEDYRWATAEELAELDIHPRLRSLLIRVMSHQFRK